MEELKILNALYLTHKKHASLYLDLYAAFPDMHPEQVKKLAEGLQEKNCLHILTGDAHHLLCRITENGIAEFKEKAGFWGTWKLKSSRLAVGVAVVAVVLVLGVLSSVAPLEVFMGDITGTGLTAQTKEILMQWVEGQEQENSDWYTFTLYEKNSDTRRTYLVECKDEFVNRCKHNILFVEVDEKSKTITNVEAGQPM